MKLCFSLCSLTPIGLQIVVTFPRELINIGIDETLKLIRLVVVVAIDEDVVWLIIFTGIKVCVQEVAKLSVLIIQLPNKGVLYL